MRIGIDLGGTKIEIAVLDPAGREVLRRRVATPTGDYEATVRTMAVLVAATEEELGCRCSVGVGIPGTVSPATGLVKNANSTWLNGRPLEHDLIAAMDRPVRTANDANCFVQSEATDGAAVGSSVAFGVILGTGVGGGVALGGRALAGVNGIAGEWGHNPLPGELPETAPFCWCGRRGCIETYLSGPGLAHDHERMTGTRLPTDQIVEAAIAGEPGATETLVRFEARLARALGTILNVLDPDVVVLGGGLSRIERLYETVPRLWNSFVFSDRIETRLVAPAHGDSSGVRGAARLWPLGEDPP